MLPFALSPLRSCNARIAGLAAFAVCVASSSPSVASPEPIDQSTLHARALDAHRFEAPAPRVWPSPQPGTRSLVNKVVYGYLPYWVSDTSQIRWDLLSHVAHFSIELNSDGSLGATHGWPDDALVATAHQAGVRVDVVFTLFSSSGLSTFLSSSGNRSAGITHMIDSMEAGGADGISIDFEGVPGAQRANLVAFLSELRAALDARGHADAGIEVAAPAVDWSDAWDTAAIVQLVDVYFIMAYDFFWTGSGVAGPSGIFRTDARWRTATSWASLRSITTAAARAGESQRARIVHGVPYYGYEYLTSGSGWPSAATSYVGSMTYRAARQSIAEGTNREWDDGICQPGLVWQSGGWHQAWYDDEQSLACKYDFVSEQELGGTGMWALGSDNGYPELWDLLEQYFVTPKTLGEGSRQQPIAVASFPYDDARDTSAGGFRYFNYYSCNPDLAEYGREFVYQFDVCRPGAFHAEVASDPSDDPDLHLLTGLRESDCLDRGHLAIDRTLQPGRYYVVVDTYVDDAVELEGPYQLHMTWEPEVGTDDCAADRVCDSGACLCASGLSDCSGACVDTSQDPLHCGACGHACADGAVCMASECGAAPVDAGVDATPDGPAANDAEAGSNAGDAAETDSGWTGSAAPLSEESSGCACATPAKRRSALREALSAWIVVAGIAIAAGRRRRHG